MSVITYNDVIAGIVKGTTWGSEGDVTSGGINLYASSISLGGGFADFLSRDFGQGGKRTNNARLAHDCNVAITCDNTYGQGWLALFAGFMGTESSPAEQTASQADYLVTIDMADAPTIYWTLGFSIESDRTISIYSMKVQSISFAQDINGAGSWTFNCMADTIREGSANTVAEIAALTDYTYETCIMGGTNHYFRIDAYSAGTALTNADDKTILGVTMNITRPMQPKRGLRGANTPYTLQPLQIGPIDATLEVKFNELNNASWDILGDYLSPSFKMAELFMDGSVIGTTVNRSLKFQFPYLKIKGAIPSGHDVKSNNGMNEPIVVYDMLKAPAAPSGMSGVTDLLRLTSIGPTRSTKWTA